MLGHETPKTNLPILLMPLLLLLLLPGENGDVNRLKKGITMTTTF